MWIFNNSCTHQNILFYGYIIYYANQNIKIQFLEGIIVYVNNKVSICFLQHSWRRHTHYYYNIIIYKCSNVGWNKMYIKINDLVALLAARC